MKKQKEVIEIYSRMQGNDRYNRLEIHKHKDGSIFISNPDGDGFIYLYPDQVTILMLFVEGKVKGVKEDEY